MDDIALREAAAAVVREMANVSKTLDGAGEILVAESDQAFTQRLRQSLVRRRIEACMRIFAAQ